MVLGLLVILIVCLVLGALGALLVVRIRKSGGESRSRSSLTTWTGSPSSSLGAQGRSAALPGESVVTDRAGGIDRFADWDDVRD
jgi:hypothetical protein